MKNIRKACYRQVIDTSVPSGPNMVLQFEDSVLCFGSAGVRVNTTVPVKVSIIGFFQTGASYHIDTGYVTANVVDQVVSAMTVYTFGIEASNGGTLGFNSRIEFTLSDFTTGVPINSYTLNRVHSASPC
jgi:hypothetical protein